MAGNWRKCLICKGTGEIIDKTYYNKNSEGYKTIPCPACNNEGGINDKI